MASLARSTGFFAERKSKRSRKGRAAVNVSNTTSLEQLRLMIYEAMSVHPKNQTVSA